MTDTKPQHTIIPPEVLVGIANGACRRPYPHPPHQARLNWQDFVGQYPCDGIATALPWEVPAGSPDEPLTVAAELLRVAAQSATTIHAVLQAQIASEWISLHYAKLRNSDNA